MNNNDIKYVMLPRIEDKARVVKPQPWYKERFREKYLKNKDKIIDPKQWVFIKDGLDDFRDGLPPPHDDLIIKPSKGPGPTIKHEKWKFKENAVQVGDRLSAYQRFFSKKIPIAETRQDYINQILEDLSKHPLALYPHLEDGLPHELFEEIMDILDPEISRPSRNQNESSFSNDQRLNDSIEKVESKILDEDSHLYRRNIREESQRLEESLKKEYEEKKKGEEEKKEIKNNYKWLLKKEDAKGKSKGPEPEKIKAKAIDAHIKKVTEEFCDWVKSLGGEHNIDQLTLTTLFASGYDTKPPLSVPINIVELTNIPAELRPHVSVPTQDNSEDHLAKKIYRQDDTSKKHGIRYGAWYLGKEHWQKMPANEKLIDPKVKNDAEKIEAKKKFEDINSRLAPLHGAQAFKKFVKDKKPLRVPKLVEDLEDWEGEQLAKSQAVIMAAQASESKNLINSNFDK